VTFINTFKQGNRDGNPDLGDDLAAIASYLDSSFLGSDDFGWVTGETLVASCVCNSITG
jgi:hypothetical protein